MPTYRPEFYASLNQVSQRSAREIIPLVCELIQPRSIIDVGCGLGSWLAVFREFQVDDILGVDGADVDRARLQIPQDKFLCFDLRQPLRLERRFDLAISLEVAEHLPPEQAGAFVDSLARLAPVVLFSAAIPFQGGIAHLNEQWPEYWAGHFQARGYRPLDCIRMRVWQNPNVQWFYAQNILLYAERDYVEAHPLLKQAAEQTAPSPLSLVHPRRYLGTADLGQVPLRRVLAALPRIVAKGVERTVNKRSL